MKNPPIYPLLVAAIFHFACHSAPGDQRQPRKDTAVVDADHPQLSAFHRNPEFRDRVKKEPVAVYHEKTGYISGDFDVKLYQTNKTLYFRVDVNWEGLPATDTVKLPDIGTAPQPVRQKGTEKMSCVIGFLDNDKQFREQKLVAAKGDQLKFTTLRHWSVADHYRLVSQ